MPQKLLCYSFRILYYIHGKYYFINFYYTEEQIITLLIVITLLAAPNIITNISYWYLVDYSYQDQYKFAGGVR